MRAWTFYTAKGCTIFSLIFLLRILCLMMQKCDKSVQMLNPLTAGPDYIRFKTTHLVPPLTHVQDKT